MDDVIDDLLRTSRRCDRAAAQFTSEPISSMEKRLSDACDSLNGAWSGGWFGYHAYVYTANFRPKRPGEFFDTEMGFDHFSDSRGEWGECTYEQVFAEVLRRSRCSQAQMDALKVTANNVKAIVEECKLDALSTLDALLRHDDDPKLRELRSKLDAVKSQLSRDEIARTFVPAGEHMSRDARAIQAGLRVPPHIVIEAWVMSQHSVAAAASSIGEITRYSARYLEKSMKLKGKTVAKTDGPIFLGHGRSDAWRDLKDLLRDRLGLSWEEFNREPMAGRSNKERLLEMLDKCPFAFLVMTAEDEQLDGTKHARANVIHEAGLFQGRYGFERAIILLEEGCEEFSNVEGLGQIRFPKGKIMAQSEEIRRVLEREKIL